MTQGQSQPLQAPCTQQTNTDRTPGHDYHSQRTAIQSQAQYQNQLDAYLQAYSQLSTQAEACLQFLQAVPVSGPRQAPACTACEGALDASEQWCRACAGPLCSDCLGWQRALGCGAEAHSEEQGQAELYRVCQKCDQRYIRSIVTVHNWRELKAKHEDFIGVTKNGHNQNEEVGSTQKQRSCSATGRLQDLQQSTAELTQENASLKNKTMKLRKQLTLNTQQLEQKSQERLVMLRKYSECSSPVSLKAVSTATPAVCSSDASGYSRERLDSESLILSVIEDESRIIVKERGCCRGVCVVM